MRTSALGSTWQTTVPRRWSLRKLDRGWPVSVSGRLSKATIQICSSTEPPRWLSPKLHVLLQVQKLFFGTLGLLGLNMFGRSASSQVWYLLQPTGIGGYRPFLICSALGVALQLFHPCDLCPILLESAFNYMWYRTNTFALTVVTLFYKYKCFLWLLITGNIFISRKEHCGFPNAFI